MVNKKEHGWIRIVEAFTMILLISGVFLMISGKNSSKDFSQKIYGREQGILREVQLNNTLRASILSFNEGSLPIKWQNFPPDLKNEITSETPDYLVCQSKICRVDKMCSLSNSVDKNIYIQEVMVSSTLNTYSPRKLKLFCWEK